MRNKILVETISLKDPRSFEEVTILDVNNTYYEVVYKGKEEYYTKSLEIARLVGKIILIFYLNLNRGNSILFSKNKSDEEKWVELVRFLQKESNKTIADKEVAISIYKTIEETYYDQLELDSSEKKEILSSRYTIRNKDNLMNTVNKISSLMNKREADKNLERYKKLRNEFVRKNPQLKLELL